MASKQLEVKLYPNGSMEVETHNIKGKACMKYMELFSELLEAQITDSAFTEEYYEQEVEEDTLVNEEALA